MTAVKRQFQAEQRSTGRRHSVFEEQQGEEITQLNEVTREEGDEVREVTRVSGHGRSWRLL